MESSLAQPWVSKSLISCKGFLWPTFLFELVTWTFPQWQSETNELLQISIVERRIAQKILILLTLNVLIVPGGRKDKYIIACSLQSKSLRLSRSYRLPVWRDLAWWPLCLRRWQWQWLWHTVLWSNSPLGEYKSRNNYWQSNNITIWHVPKK